MAQDVHTKNYNHYLVNSERNLINHLLNIIIGKYETN